MTMDKEKLKDFLPVLGSPFWARVIEDYVEPELEKARDALEQNEGQAIRGRIQLLREMLKLKEHAKTMLEEE
jgi:hypothetical protein